MVANRFDQLIEQWDPVIRRAFLNAIAQITDRVRIGAVAEALERGDINGAVRLVDLDPVAFRALDAAISQAFEAGGVYTTDRIPALRQPSGYRLKVQFDVRNLRAEALLREASASLIRQIVTDQVVMVRDFLSAGMQAGRNPRSVALDLVGRINQASGRREGGVIGLTSSQEQWVQRYEQELRDLDAGALKRELRDRRFDRTIAKALREGKPLPQATIDKMLRSYRNKALQYRAETIARTEALRALHQSQIEAFRQAIAAGQVNEAAVLKVWHSAADERVRHTHRILHGQAVGFEDDFISPSGAHLGFPGDPKAPGSETIMCRCWMDTKIDFLAGID
jgi:hypothetical protein